MPEIGKIGGIRLEGRNFEKQKYLPLLTVQTVQKKGNEKIIENEATRVSIIYGENGSGKTTISKVFLKIKGVDEDINSACLLDAEKNKVDIKDDVDNIFVFNEDYINDNLKIKQDGLSTIVILGDQNDVDKQIKQIKKEDLDPVIGRINSLENERLKYEDSLNSNSPEYYLSRMKSKLQGDENWAGRQRFIKGNRRNESVSNNRYKDFINLSPKVSRDKLIEKFHDLKIELGKIRDSKSNNKLSTLNLNNYISNLRENIERLNKLLQQEIDSPKLSEFDRELIETIKNSPRINLNRTQQILKNTEINFCPTCLQEIDDSYRKKMLKFIERFLNRDVEQYKAKLKELTIAKSNIDFIIFSDIQGLDKVRRAKSKLDNIIDKTNQQIQVKIDNPYTSIVINNKFSTILQNFEECIKAFDAKIIEYNKNIPDVSSILEEMSRVNNEIAHYDIINDYRIMEELRKKKEKVIEDYNRFIEERNEIKEKLNVLEERKKNINIALDVINYGLEYIFFSKDRLYLKYQDNKYVLYTHGNPVTPNNVSVGERNIIALCYFFVSILMGKSEDAYKDSYLIVIDDPISSFDMENRIGIMSYLKYKLSEFLTSNKNTQVVLLTHDLQVLFDSEKMINEILGSGVRNSRSYQLREKELIPCNKSVRNGYSRLMCEVYDYGNNDKTIDRMIIGNEMRKLLESFSTFNYRQGIEKVSLDEAILNKIDKSDRSYYKNLMYRLVLHGESHTEERIDTLDDINFFDFISEKEKRRTARDIICFLYALDSVHVLKHLTKQGKKENEITKNIEAWSNHN
ncbi:AAA family ATPase [Limosilactobacillus albertensis]|uniref:AAA family ATPase n=1 Tax=Limosilactobacillus albertensis TaxID=2759752 RepID=UPI001E5E6A16|nr:AAA family ATPase [Limosilactobacillus albertensis]MCD7121893.1 AAA family ATPase [Limosilactobacillus albertensis]